MVDLVKGMAIRVVDKEDVPVPEDDWGYTSDEVAARLALRPAPSPVSLSQAGGPGHAMTGSRIEWDIWRFRLRVDKRPGVVLSNIDVRDGEECAAPAQSRGQAHSVPHPRQGTSWRWR